MHVWDIGALKAELRAGPMSPRRLLPYLIAYGVLLTLCLYVPWLAEVAPANPWDAVSLVASLVALALGLLAAYRANGGAGGEDFAPRLVSLSWVLCWRLLPILVFFALVTMLLQPGQSATIDAPTTAVDVGAFVLYQVLYYWRLAVQVRDVAGPSGSPGNSAT